MISSFGIVLATWCLQQAVGFSSIPSNSIKIVGLPGGQVQSLPGMYVQSFERWIVHEDNSKKDEHSFILEPIVGTGLSDEDGWVNPTTTDELWWPADLSTIQTRPMLNILFKNGVLSYLSTGLDVRVPYKDESGDVITWRNYGLKSQPIARQWTTLDIAMEKLFHVEGFILHNKEENEEIMHEELFTTLYAAPTLEKVANFIPQIDQESPLFKGFHIVSFPMSKFWVDLPTPIRSKNDEEEPTSAYKLVCFATSEPFASKLLDLDEIILEMSSTSVLEATVTRTEGGAKSQYLPEVYKRLYL